MCRSCIGPGEAQVDFGEAQVKLCGQQVKVALFVMTCPYSDAIFCQAFPRECTEAFQEGHKRAFEFFAGVPRRISYDNSKIAVAKIVGGRGREVTREFARLESHFLFEHHFCLVRRPNEKGHVENLLGFARRNYLVPLPEIARLEELNVALSARCREDLNRQLRGKAATKGHLLAEERAWFVPLPAQEFEARRVKPAKANSLSLVAFRMQRLLGTHAVRASRRDGDWRDRRGSPDGGRRARGPASASLGSGACYVQSGPLSGPFGA